MPHRGMRAIRPLAVCALAWALSASTGCSLLFVKGRTAHGPECTRSRGAPVLDGFLSAVLVAGGIGGLVVPESKPTCSPSEIGTMCFDFSGVGKALSVMSLVLAAPYLASSVWGFNTVNACREAYPEHVAAAAASAE